MNIFELKDALQVLYFTEIDILDRSTLKAKSEDHEIEIIINGDNSYFVQTGRKKIGDVNLKELKKVFSDIAEEMYQMDEGEIDENELEY